MTMNGKVLLDTNIMIALLADDTAVKDNLAQCAEVFTAVTVIGELYYGAQKSGRAGENLERVNALALNMAVLDCDLETARWYGVVKSKLQQIGKPIPENDVWIAAIALQHQLKMITRDRHFREVSNLQVEAW